MKDLITIETKTFDETKHGFKIPQPKNQTNSQHNFKSYELTHSDGKKEIFSACCRCGTIEVKGGNIGDGTCCGKMLKTSNVKMLGMKLMD